MSEPPIHEDVYDPTADPRHKPPTALPGTDPDVPRPRHVSPGAPPPPDEPAIVHPESRQTGKPADQPG